MPRDRGDGRHRKHQKTREEQLVVTDEDTACVRTLLRQPIEVVAVRVETPGPDRNQCGRLARLLDLVQGAFQFIQQAPIEAVLTVAKLEGEDRIATFERERSHPDVTLARALAAPRAAQRDLLRTASGR